MPQPHQKRRPQNQRQTRPNKAQQREAQVRAQQMEQMAAEPSLDLLAPADDVPIEADPIAEAVATSTVPAPAAASRQPKRRESRTRARQSIVAQTQPAISRGQEYEFIRADLRRLLITAGIVLVLMLALLFVIEG
ncbi:MAG: hypothetical protein QM589_15585 [Thermomicrobiales bacterium]